MRQIKPIAGEDYSTLLMGRDQPLMVTMADGTNVTYDPVGGTTTQPPTPTPQDRIASLAGDLGTQSWSFHAARAVAAYMAANNGDLPAGLPALLPYFATPQEGADFTEAHWMQRKTDTNKPGTDRYAESKTSS